MRKKIFVMISLTISFFFILYSSSGLTATYYVATNGNDANNGLYPTYQGGFKGPFKTVNKGASILAAGDILSLRGGVYYETVYIGKSGREGAPITIAGYPGEAVIIDGQYRLPTAEWGDLFSATGNYVVVRNLTVKNSKWLGLVLRGEHDQAIHVRSEGHMETGILITANYSTVDSCEVYYNAKSNEFGRQVRPGNTWASGLSAARHPFYAAIRKCKVWNNWGEGLSTFEAEHSTLEDNVVWDNWGPNVYLSDTKHTILQRNLIYWTPGNPCSGYGGSNVAIMLGDEKYNPPSSDNKIINNFVKAGNRCFYSWLGAKGGGLVNVLIANNTFVNANSDAEANFKVLNGTHSNTRIQNNIVEQVDSVPVLSVEGSAAGIIFSHNLWSKKPPAAGSGPGDVIGDALLSKTGAVHAGTLSPEYFRIFGTSPARGRAKVLTEVTEDFFRNSRGVSPDIGGHQYDGKRVIKLTPPTGLKLVEVH